MPNFSIGVDLGGTNLRIAAVEEQGSLLEKISLGTRVTLGRDHVINDMCDAVQHLTAKYKDLATLEGIGIGVPGIIDMRTGMIRESPNLPGWADSPVRRRLKNDWARGSSWITMRMSQPLARSGWERHATLMT